MQSIQTLNLIAGTFTADEAEELLQEMIKIKINFHNLKNFISMVKHDEPDYLSRQRIKELTELQEEIKQLVNMAKLVDKKLKISSAISIQLEA